MSEVSLELEFEGELDNAELLPDGSRIVYGARVLAPPEYAGQIRDIVLWADGSMHLGPDQGHEP